MGSYYSTASQIRDIDRRILAVLIATCGITDPDAAMMLSTSSFTVDTDAGELRVTFSPGDDGKLPNRGKVGLPGAVYGRFTDVDRAVSVLGRYDVNPFSGKWNFHFSNGYPPEAMAPQLRRINPHNFTLRPRYWSPKDVDAPAAL